LRIGTSGALESGKERSFEYRGVVFDLDGVLVDSIANAERHWETWSRRHGLNPEAVLPALHGRRTVETIHEVAPRLGRRVEAEELDRRESEDAGGVVPMVGAAGLLASLPPDGWAIATSSSLKLASARLRAAGLPVPRVIVTADDVRCGRAGAASRRPQDRALGQG
jgi:sugar-phosphatase